MASQRPARIGDQIRQEISDLLAREVHDPGIGFLTITHVNVTADLQLARVNYTTLGDEKARKDTKRALERATPFLRRQLGKPYFRGRKGQYQRAQRRLACLRRGPGRSTARHARRQGAFFAVDPNYDDQHADSDPDASWLDQRALGAARLSHCFTSRLAAVPAVSARASGSR